MRSHLTYANVMATIAVFVALGGVSYAVTALPKNSVGAKQLKKNAVTTVKVKNQAITAAKVEDGALTGKQVNAATLGTVPNAQTATTAGALAPSDPWHFVGTPGEPPFLNGWALDTGDSGAAVAFRKDHDGVVHLRGVAGSGKPGDAIFELPPGYRPGPGKILSVPMACGGGANCNTVGVAQGAILGSGLGPPSNSVEPPGGGTGVSLEGVSFVPQA